MCVIISSASAVVGSSHYRHGGVSVLSPNSVVSPENKRVSSRRPASTVPENPLLMRVPYLQEKGSATEKDAFTWVGPLFCVILSLFECCFHLRSPPTLPLAVHVTAFLSLFRGDNDSTNLQETFCAS